MGLVLVGVFIIEYAAFRYLLPDPVSWTTYSKDRFTCQVPEGNNRFVEEGGWHKHIFESGRSRLYVSVRPLQGAPDEAIQYYRVNYLNPVFESRITVFENGRFFLGSRGKSRRYIYIFSVAGQLFWVENYVRGSSLRTYKDYLDNVVESLEVSGRRVQPGFALRARELNGRIIWHSQGPRLIGGLMFGLPAALIIAVMILVMMFAGRLPDFEGRRPVLSAENVLVWFRRRVGVNGTLAAAALFDDRFEVYTWKQSRMVITPGTGTVSVEQGKDRIVARLGSLSASIEVENAGRWLAELSARGFGRVEP